MGQQTKIDINDPELDAAFDEYEKFAKIIATTAIVACYVDAERVKLRTAIAQAVVNAVLKTLTAGEKKGESDG